MYVSYGSTIDGLWTAEFGSSTGVFGGGVVVFQNGKVMGGDAGYYYLGDYRLTEGALVATIEISAFIKGFESVFNTVGQNLKLNLVGSIVDETHVIAQGHPEQMPNLRLGVKLTKRS
jgi:hypothetical protein